MWAGKLPRRGNFLWSLRISRSNTNYLGIEEKEGTSALCSKALPGSETQLPIWQTRLRRWDE